MNKKNDFKNNIMLINKRTNVLKSKYQCFVHLKTSKLKKKVTMTDCVILPKCAKQ